MTRPAACDSVKREVAELSLLHEISRMLDRSLDLHEVVGPVLQAMDEYMGVRRGTLTLKNRDTGELQVEAAHGLSARERERGRYRPGEGVTGRVIETAQPAVIPRIRDEPRFLDRTGARRDERPEDLSFVCVPVKLGTTVLGALSVDRAYAGEDVLGEDVRLLSIIASMIAQAVRLRQSVMEERERLLEENRRLQSELGTRYRPDNIVGKSQGMQAVYDAIAQVAGSETTVLVRGESGSGKELVAHAIHHAGPRRTKPYVKVNCAALPESVLESELFGHEKGAFTGAVSARKGRFELAQGGTIFLDEVGDLSTATQSKLLRVLQEREFERVGGTRSLRVDVRVIAATNRDLEALIPEGRFREDLYYRLNVFPIHIPPLRNRKSDILLLADHFVTRYAQANRKTVKRISTPAIDMLTAYHWPGNVRELENCIERAVLLTHDEVIHSHHLPPSLQTAEASDTVHRGTLRQELDRLERELVLDALKSARGNCARAARALGVSERVVGLRLKKYGIDFRRFRTSL